ncbi:MAG: tetratricopeptide repeat protein [Candidatus Brocadiaceae bacterium]|jgi:tetratricopeptide (TPR) repeat protein
MRRFGTMIAPVLLTVLLAPALFARDDGTWTAPAERLQRACDAPLEDAGAGRLYEKAAELLNAARDLPERIELPEPRPAVPEDQAAEEEEAQEQPVEIPEPPREQWVPVVEEPIAPPRELAWLYYMAGRYQQAGELYRRLHEKDPGDEHVLMMLLLSERNAGRIEEARELLSRTKADAPCRSWADWMFQMQQIGESQEEAAP